MKEVAFAALGVGGSTIIGAVIGFLVKAIPHKWNDAITSLAAGIMLSAAVLGLIVPATEMMGTKGLWMVVLGIFAGAACLNLMDRVTPHLHALVGIDRERHAHNEGIDKVLLFVCAVAIHNLPEGLAAGVGFAGSPAESGGAISVAVGISLQNIPEGIMLVPPMILAGVPRGRAFCVAAVTGLIEVAGTFLGYLAGGISQVILPFALAFAGGTMLYVVSDEMIPETHSHGYERMATYALLTGFVIMLLADTML